MQRALAWHIDMSNDRHFQRDEHDASFHLTAEAKRFGAPTRVICGTRTLRGVVCKRVPILKGTGRSRERPREGLLSGRISVEEWRRAEARLAANKLREKSKKNPRGAGQDN